MDEICQTVEDCMHIHSNCRYAQHGFENFRVSFCQLFLSHTLKLVYSIFPLTTVHIERTNLHKEL